jgi:hypothetical protein
MNRCSTTRRYIEIVKLPSVHCLVPRLYAVLSFSSSPLSAKRCAHASQPQRPSQIAGHAREHRHGQPA